MVNLGRYLKVYELRDDFNIIDTKSLGNIPHLSKRLSIFRRGNIHEFSLFSNKMVLTKV